MGPGGRGSGLRSRSPLVNQTQPIGMKQKKEDPMFDVDGSMNMENERGEMNPRFQIRYLPQINSPPKQSTPSPI